MSTTIDIHMSTSVEIVKPTLSPTALDNYEVCGKRLQYYLDPDIPGRTTLGLAAGRAWHHAMEVFGRYRLWAQETGYHFDELPDDWVTNLEALMFGYLHEQVMAEDFIWNEADNWDKTVDQLRTMLWSWAGDNNSMWIVPDRSEHGSAVTVSALEVLVHTELGSDYHQLRGYIDAVYDFMGDPILVDYKSAAKAWGAPKVWVDDETGRLMGDPRKLIQAPLYAEGWMRATGQQVNWVVFDVMTHAGKFQRVWTDVSPEVREPLIERWREVSATVHLYQEAGLDMPTNPGHHLCSPKWCAYWDRCPMGEAFNQRRESK